MALAQPLQPEAFLEFLKEPVDTLDHRGAALRSGNPSAATPSPSALGGHSAQHQIRISHKIAIKRLRLVDLGSLLSCPGASCSCSARDLVELLRTVEAIEFMVLVMRKTSEAKSFRLFLGRSCREGSQLTQLKVS
jgi:hypothetical protein